jgi:HAD superfamily hydrolase (TIGR01549 family)
MIKTVIFDLGRVLIPFDFARGYRAMADKYGIAPEDIPAKLRPTGLVTEYESGQLSTPDFVARIGNLLGISTTPDEFLELWSAIFERRTLIPESVPATLRENGYRVLLLSNTNDMHFRFLRANYPILEHFDDLVLSYKVGATKPSPKIYAAAIEKADCAPGECFFTDDIEEYVEGARRAGIDAVQFRQYEQLREELLVRGVKI